MTGGEVHVNGHWTSMTGREGLKSREGLRRTGITGEKGLTMREVRALVVHDRRSRMDMTGRTH